MKKLMFSEKSLKLKLAFPFLILAIALIVAGSVISNSSFADSRQKVFTYTVKGIIKRLPENGKIPVILHIKHEEIPDYVNELGEKVGMHAMTMPFEVDHNLSLAGLEAGDRIEFTFESWWKPTPGDIIVSIKEIEPLGAN